MQRKIQSEEDMLAFGAALAVAVNAALAKAKTKQKFESGTGILIFLHGLLGAGKTTLVRGYLRACHIEGKIKSPTYTLVEPYEMGVQKVFHFDLYRINDPAELNYLGLEEYFVDDHICFVEWPEQGGDYLPKADLNIHIEFVGAHQRKIQIEAQSEMGELICAGLK